MNALASALETAAKIVRESVTEQEARHLLWKKILETQAGNDGDRNAYRESYLRGMFAALTALGAPEIP